MSQTTEAPSLVIPAPAKLNLALAVRHPSSARRSDALHEITSWMHRIDLAGDVRLSVAPATSLHRAWADDAPKQTPIDWPASSDLVFRAHAALEARAGRTLPTRIEVVKRVPVGGGLGGGSSEAASTLAGLNQLHRLGLSPAELRSVASKIGSDLAFFLPMHDGSAPISATVSGTGDRIEPANPSSAGAVLIVPPFGCETGAVYRAFDQLPPTPWRPDAVRSLPGGDLLGAPLFNDLAHAARLVRPALSDIERATARDGAPTHVTGSGSTLFVLCEEGDEPRLTAELRGPAASLGAAVVPTRLSAKA